MTKKIIRAEGVVELNNGSFATAKDALRSLSGKTSLFGLLGTRLYDVDVPASFKLAAKVRFTRTDGKKVTRRVLQTVKSWTHDEEEYDPNCHCYFQCRILTPGRVYF